jgi:hypothetical protein
MILILPQSSLMNASLPYVFTLLCHSRIFSDQIVRELNEYPVSNFIQLIDFPSAMNQAQSQSESDQTVFQSIQSVAEFITITNSHAAPVWDSHHGIHGSVLEDFCAWISV